MSSRFVNTNLKLSSISIHFRIKIPYVQKLIKIAHNSSNIIIIISSVLLPWRLGLLIIIILFVRPLSLFLGVAVLTRVIIHVV
ncbi:hypothetical protein RRF57_010819 [Xylaria bambusicola]|uniref:Uncharacterized protein n=1 Tax=Xylaria bambusicola TaxID=326684 RepID=A0AAN7Z9R2_9PEZI